MKVEVKYPKSEIVFGSLAVLDTFIIETHGTLFMKLMGNDGRAVCLTGHSKGYISNFEFGSPVIPVKTKLVNDE